MSPIKQSAPPKSDLDVFSLLHDFNLESSIYTFKGKELPNGRSKIELNLWSSDLKINMNPMLYNNLVNIYWLFKVSSEEEDVQNLIWEK